MDNISHKIQQATQNWNIDAIVNAVIADDPDMAEHATDFRETLIELQSGKLGNVRITSPIAETRHRVNLSQPKFAEKLGISVNTLRSWEQGLRKPSGAAKTLLDLLHRKPELVHELHA